MRDIKSVIKSFCLLDIKHAPLGEKTDAADPGVERNADTAEAVVRRSGDDGRTVRAVHWILFESRATVLAEVCTDVWVLKNGVNLTIGC